MAFILDVLVGGILAGIVATVILTVLMMILMDEEVMPTQLFASKFVNDETPEENEMLGLGLHFGYGIVAGIVFLALTALGGFADAILGSVLFGLLFGTILWLGSVFWRGILGTLSEMRSAPREELRDLLLMDWGMHLVWGVVAGLVGAVGAGLV